MKPQMSHCSCSFASLSLALTQWRGSWCSPLYLWMLCSCSPSPVCRDSFQNCAPAHEPASLLHPEGFLSDPSKKKSTGEAVSSAYKPNSRHTFPLWGPIACPLKCSITLAAVVAVLLNKLNCKFIHTYLVQSGNFRTACLATQFPQEIFESTEQLWTSLYWGLKFCCSVNAPNSQVPAVAERGHQTWSVGKGSNLWVRMGVMREKWEDPLGSRQEAN